MPTETNRYIQFGCGNSAPPSWRNFDAGPAFRLYKSMPLLRPWMKKKRFPTYPPFIEYGDVIVGLPVEPASVSVVYCSHVLEHLTRDELRTTLRNVFSYLQPGGTFRLVLPDLEFLIKQYVQSTDEDASDRFMEDSSLGVADQVPPAKRMAQAYLSRSRHLWMWDQKSLTRELAAAGFTGIRRAVMGDNPDPMFADVEHPIRWENCLGMECRRPWL